MNPISEGLSPIEKVKQGNTGNSITAKLNSPNQSFGQLKSNRTVKAGSSS